MAATKPFWKTTPLERMTSAEWESLCDGCGRCCLNKIEWVEDGALDYTDVACRLLDRHSCRCKDYLHRFQKVDDCIGITPENLKDLTWLPPTCGYRLVAEGRDLYWWHPLVSGDPQTVHEAGISVRGRCVSEAQVPDAKLPDHVVSWPGERVEVEEP